MNIIPFKPEHALRIVLQDEQADMKTELSPEALAASGESFTAMVGDEVIAVVGRARQWDRRWVVWAMLSKNAGPHMLAVTRFTKRLLELGRMDGRMELMVKSSFSAGHRWARILGFKWHHHEEQFLPGGVDADIYVRFP